jgi:hypothetical protein
MATKMFPISFFYDGPEGRIIMTNSFAECLGWVGELRDTDYVMFTDAWYVDNAAGTLKILNAARRPENMYFLSNDRESVYIRSRNGARNCFLIHKNAWSCHTRFHIMENVEYKYDAVKNGRLAKFKRHYLARKVGEECKLALVCGQHAKIDIDVSEIPPHAYINRNHLGPHNVCEILNQSRVGLALSAVEGCCFASTEYLLCGLPVVSTKSRGGRDVWYNRWNSVIVEDDEEAVLDGVKYFLKNPPDRQKIRQQAIDEQMIMRGLFVQHIMQPILDEIGAPHNAREVFDRIDLHLHAAFRGKIWRNIDEVREIIAAPPGQGMVRSMEVAARRAS